MAFERIQDKTLVVSNLGSFIEKQLGAVSAQRARANQVKENAFHQAVLDDSLSLDQQLSWREQQLKDTDGTDMDEVARVKGEVSSLRQQVKQQKFTDEYTQEVTKMNGGMQSVDATISWLQTTLINTTDQATKSKINDELSKLATVKFTSQQNMITKQTEYANNSQMSSVINDQLDKVKQAKVDAINSGDMERSAMLDLQIQSLNKTLTETNVQDKLLNFAVSTATGQSATALLDAFNHEVATSSKTDPITIGGTTYESEQQYWQVQRGQYLNDRSSNGFFGRYQGELQEKIDYKQSSKTLDNSTLAEVQTSYNDLKDRPELTDYQNRIATDSQKATQYTADKRADQIVNLFSTDLNTQKALGDLAFIQDKYGVDQTISYQKIVQGASQEKQAQISHIISSMQGIMQAEPGLTAQAAMQKAIQAGAGTIFTPEQLTTSNASDLILNGAKTTNNGKSPIDATPADALPFATPPSNMTEGGLYKTANNSTVYTLESGKLRPFTGNFTPEDFKAQTGKDFSAVQTVPSVAGIATGAPITKTVSPTAPAAHAQPIMPTPTAAPGTTPTTTPSTMPNQQDTTVGAHIPDPGLLAHYTADQIVRRGTDVFLKPGVAPVWGQTIKPDQAAQYKPDQIIKTKDNTYLKQ